ncbi:MAG: hypothetical protein KUG75_06520 [Pseudomonadales bacterium]|nr:hypothetical protein [Pseudomonadales bacterium]
MSLPWRVWFVQLLISLVVVFSMVCIDFYGDGVGGRQALSASSASMAFLIPNAIFASYASDGRKQINLSAKLASRSVTTPESETSASKSAQHRNAGGEAQRILLQQCIKMLLTVILLVLALSFVRPEPLGFFCALIAVPMGYLAAPFVGGK